MVERFQNEPDGPLIFLLSLKAGGTGLNLTRANHVFHFDRWGNPAVENQATDRAFGQKRNVQVHKFVCIGTLAERIDEIIESNKALPEDPAVFWKGKSPAEAVLSDVRKPPVAAALPRRLGHFPFWRGNAPFLDTMQQIYEKVSEEISLFQQIDQPDHD